MKKAIIYVGDIKLGYCDGMICCEEQTGRIKSFCRQEDIQIVEVVKEITPENELFDRPGIQYLLNKCSGVDYVVVERPWCIGRRAAVLEAFLKKLAEKQVKLLCATRLWDCASQYVRRYYHKNWPEQQPASCQHTAEIKAG
jgi:DNA invertase Pin-like site-specific DNA recombinase